MGPADGAMGLARRHAGTIAIAIAIGVLARAAISHILARCGEPAATLDDAYIHFQYARAFAEGHPFRFQAGEPPSSGATSFLWPLALALFYKVGFTGKSILWAAWGLSYAAYGALAWEAWALTSKLANHAAAIGAAALVLSFGGLQWFAPSGMEVLPFAWAITSTVRRSAEWVEEPLLRSARRRNLLCAFAFLCPLLRPEGAIFSLAPVVALAAFPASRDLRTRALAIVPLLSLALLPAILHVVTGDAQSSTARVKLLSGTPYPPWTPTAWENVRTFVTKLLNGEIWSAEFLPKGGAPVAFASIGAIGTCGVIKRRPFRAVFVIAIALAALVPCLYVTFLWNRLRYLWPFSTGWLVGLACIADLLGQFAGSLHRRARHVSLLVIGVFAGLFGSRHDGVVEDVANSASGIDRQQVALGRWARANLPEGARIGVNDTGAIAYFGDRRTFDIVGLTTQSEGRYWVAGAASRYEHYERLRRDRPELLPTHFIVYAEWMACDAVLGELLHEVTVTDSSILGGQTMRVYVANYDHLGKGELPWTPGFQPADTVDVADVESERAHGYDLAGARDTDETIHSGLSPAGGGVIDGGRTARTRDAFRVRLGQGRHRGIVRALAPSPPSTLRILAAAKEIARVTLSTTAWEELAFDLPAGMGGEVDVEVIASGSPVTTFHYWFE